MALSSNRTLFAREAPRRGTSTSSSCSPDKARCCCCAYTLWFPGSALGGSIRPGQSIGRSVHPLTPAGEIRSTYVEKMSKAEPEMEMPSSKATLSANRHVVSPVCPNAQNVARDALCARTALPSIIGSPPANPKGRILQRNAEAPSPTPPPNHKTSPPQLHVEGLPSPAVCRWMIGRTGKNGHY